MILSRDVGRCSWGRVAAGGYRLLGAAAFVGFISAPLGCSSGASTSELVGEAREELVISGLFPTGVDAAGAAIANGATDPHYALSSNDLALPGPKAIATNPLGGGWLANTGTSRWISPQLDGQGIDNGVYTYTTTFTLAGVNPTSAVITGTWACDDTCSVALNGTQVATLTAAGAWTQGVAFTIPAGSPFLVGANVLTFRTNNSGGSVTGLRVDKIGGSVNGCTRDDQCTAAQYCDTQAAACTAKLANGVPIPTITGHDPSLTGKCTLATGAAVCASGICDVHDDKCGYADGDGPCSILDAGSVCRSGACSLDLTCEPAAGCNVDADCTADQWCNEASHACTATLPNGTPIPTDPGHTPTLDGDCTLGAGALVCASRVCDASDDKCGYANGDGPCTVATAGTVCRSGSCGADLKCVANGACNVDADCSISEWCDISAHTCEAKLPNGDHVPTDAGHAVPTLDGTCTLAAGALTCQSAVCDAADDKCGYANGDGPCLPATGATLCRSGQCSFDGTCIPAGGCDVDLDCPSETPTCEGHVCTGCSMDSDCPDAAPICDAATHACGACTGDFTTPSAAGDCPTAALPACQPAGSPLAGACTACSATVMTNCSGDKPVCATAQGVCGCTEDAQCPKNDYCDVASVASGVCTEGCRVVAGVDNCATGLVCSKQDGTVGICEGGACTTNADCAAPTPVCDLTQDPHFCVQCVSDTDCAGGQTCEAHMCVTQGQGGAGGGSSSTASSMSTATSMSGTGGAAGDVIALGGGCSVGGSSTGDSGRVAFALGALALVLGARRRRR